MRFLLFGSCLAVIATIICLRVWGAPDMPHAGPVSPGPLGVGAQPASHDAPKAEAASPAAVVSDAPTKATTEPARVAAPIDPPVDWEQEARAFMSLPHGGDGGLDTIARGLQMVFEGGGPFGQGDPFRVDMPKIEDLERSRDWNPTRRNLTAEERRQLEELLADFGARMRREKRDTFLATQLSLAEAVRNGDYVRKPNGSDPDGIWQRVVDESRGDFENERDQNISEMPGADLSHNRVVILRPAKYPRHARALREQRATEAEFQIAVRMFFLPAGRR